MTDPAAATIAIDAIAEALPNEPASPQVERDAPATTTAEQDRQTAGERLALRTAPPVTTEEQDRVSAGQRTVNLMWESTQRQIAVAVIGCALIVASALAVFGKYIGSADVQLAANVFLYGVANLVTGFYFGRTNHQRSGGVGGDSAGPR